MQIANVPGSLCDEFRLFNLAVLELLLRRQLISKASHEDNQKPMVFLHFYVDQKGPKSVQPNFIGYEIKIGGWPHAL